MGCPVQDEEDHMDSREPAHAAGVRSSGEGGGWLSKATATDIALAYREVETAERLLAEVREAISRRAAPDIRDAFGRLQPGLQLGVPSGDSSTRLFNVPWALAVPVIEAHVANQRAMIAALTEKARAEIAANASPPPTPEDTKP